MKRSILVVLLVVAWCLPVHSSRISPPQVVVSIKPIHSLTAAVMEGVAIPQLLIKGAGSPHGYSLRPSEARMLANADLVIWVGEGLETFLTRPLANLGSHAQQLELAQHLAANMLPVRAGGSWEGHGHDAHGHDAHGHDAHGHDAHGHDAHGHDAHGHDAHGHGQNHEEPDYHLWTSPILAKDIVSLIAEQLMTIDPKHATTYAANAASLLTELDRLYHDVKQQLQPVTDRPYIVFHDAYQYFERDFGLNAVGSVTIDTERAPGARRVKEVRDKIAALKARAVFSEPQFQSRIVATVIEGTGAATGVLDPLGAELEEGPEAYPLMIRALAAGVLETLQ